MRHSKFKDRYPACVKAGLNVKDGKQSMKITVEEELEKAVMKVVPVPPGHRKKELSVHIPPHGEEEDPHFGKWYKIDPRTRKVTYLTPHPLQQTHPDLVRGDSSIARLLQARLELSRLTKISRALAKRDQRGKATANFSSPLQSRRAVIPASVLNSVRAARNQGAAPAAAAGQVLVSIGVGAARRQVGLAPDQHGRIRLSDFKVELGQIGLEVGENYEQYISRWDEWVPILWTTKLAVDSSKCIALRKSDLVRNSRNVG
ncbi:hypothetical protein PQX77_002307 [Marasmius sp. AFHP31]|nr:hypothetical protein PQX77_002307 [Marasmius sp. AFHP31]